MYSKELITILLSPADGIHLNIFVSTQSVHEM